MSIIDTFDNSAPLISPGNFYKKGNIAEKCIVTFSHKVLDDVLKRYKYKKEVCSGTANGKIQVYSLMQKNEKILFYMSPIGSACAGCIMDEVNYLTGAKQFIVFGSCGSLNNELTSGKFIVPTESYRDEGFSYHYLKPSDYIKVANWEEVSRQFDVLSIPYVNGRTWTTDAIYRETEGNVAKRKSDGCISVEMESAGLQALCSYKGLELYTFFFASDLVDGEVWENVNLGTEEERKKQINCFEIALKLAELI